MSLRLRAREIKESELLTKFREQRILFDVPNRKEDKHFQIAFIMYAFMVHGPKANISELTGIHEEYVNIIRGRLRRAGIIDQESYYFEDLNPEDPIGTQIEFILHLLCADGKILRVKPEKLEEA
jgi:hypothetical protein